MDNQISNMDFSAYCQKMEQENKLKAIVYSISAGFLLSLIVATWMWFCRLNALLPCLLIMVIFAVAGPRVLLRTVLKSTEESLAKRLDRYGLEERAVTMVERMALDDSMSRLQRSDAREKITQLGQSFFTVQLPRRLLIFMSVCGLFACTMTTVSALAATGRIVSGADLLGPVLPGDSGYYIYIEYIADGGGYIEGDEFQEIEAGQTGTSVRAVPDEGWIFVGWDDEWKNPDRLDENVQQDMVFIAVFVPIEDEMIDIYVPGFSGDGEKLPEGEAMDSLPGSGDGSDTPGGDSDGSESNSSGASGKYESANQIIDGETYYREVIEHYWSVIEEMLSSGQEIPEEIREIIQLYFDTIQ